MFRDVILPASGSPPMPRRARSRIWCAAVSSGQEAYSLAMILDEAAARLAGWTDRDPRNRHLGRDHRAGRAGLYSQFEVQRGLPIQLLLKHFPQEGDNWQLSPSGSAPWSSSGSTTCSRVAASISGSFDVDLLPQRADLFRRADQGARCWRSARARASSRTAPSSSAPPRR